MTKTATGVFYKKAILKTLAIFTGKHLCWGLFLIKLQAFPVNIAKFLRTPILMNICERVFLTLIIIRKIGLSSFSLRTKTTCVYTAISLGVVSTLPSKHLLVQSQ